MSPDVSAAFGNLHQDAGLRGAQLALTRLRGRIATSGVDAMRDDPALLADVDQHAAAVRDALIEATGRITTAGLAAYADGVTDAAADNDWFLPADPDGSEWSAPSWPLVRLLAVCVIAEAADLI
jgi:DNA-binding FrmR family transcriptional regulator